MLSIKQESNTPLLNVLVAYPYCKESVIDFLKSRDQNEFRFVLDSGAFTAYTTGKKIELDDYCRFLERLPVKPWRYFQLDAIADPEKTARNYEIMLERGFNPIPVIPHNERLERMDELWKTSEVVGVGGLAVNRNNKHIVQRVMRHAKGRKVHLLGFTNDEFLKYYKPYMCDASTVTAGARFGELDVYLGNGKTKRIKKKAFRERPSKEIEELLKKAGVNPFDLAKKSNWINKSNDISPHIAVSFYSWCMKSLDYEKYVGTKIFISIACASQLETLFKMYDRIKEAGYGRSRQNY